MSSIAQDYSLFEIDRELDTLLDEIEEENENHGEAQADRDLKKIEGREFTLRIQKNSQDSVRFTDETQVPMRYRNISARIEGQLWEKLIESAPEELKRPLVASIQDAPPYNEAIKQAVQNQVAVPGAEVYRGDHLRLA